MTGPLDFMKVKSLLPNSIDTNCKVVESTREWPIIQMLHELDQACLRLIFWIK